MKRRTWFKTVAAFGVAAMWPWKKRNNARLCYADVTYNFIDVDRDQLERIRRLHGSDSKIGWIRDTTDWRLSIVGIDDGVHLYWDSSCPISDGKYATASCAVKKQVAKTMDDVTLCRKLACAMLVSLSKRHRVGLFSIGPPPEWIT